MYIFVMGMEGRLLSEILKAILHRIFIGQIHPFYFWQLYLETNDFFGVSGLPNPGGVLPFIPESVTVKVWEFAHPEMAETGIVGSMPTVYYAYWMLNFGYISAIGSMLLFGCIIQLAEIVLTKKMREARNVYFIAFYVLMVDYFSKFISEGYEGILFDFQWIIPLFICFFYSFYSASFKLKRPLS
jgi:hypothetical protein